MPTERSQSNPRLLQRVQSILRLGHYSLLTAATYRGGRDPGAVSPGPFGGETRHLCRVHLLCGVVGGDIPAVQVKRELERDRHLWYV